MTTAVVVPLDTETARFRGERGAAWFYVRARLRAQSGPVVSHATVGDWCKARSVGLALDDSPDVDVLVVHDADVLVAPAALRRALDAIDRGAAWAVPHDQVRRLTRASTEDLMERGPYQAGGHRLDRPAYRGVAGGGIVVIRRDVYDQCPLDPRFCGWGSEDEAWGWALETLHGQPWRGNAPLTHLWHGPQPVARRSTRGDSIRLWRAYRSAQQAGDMTAMAVLVAGARGNVRFDPPRQADATFRKGTR